MVKFVLLFVLVTVTAISLASGAPAAEPKPANPLGLLDVVSKQKLLAGLTSLLGANRAQQVLQFYDIDINAGNSEFKILEEGQLRIN